MTGSTMRWARTRQCRAGPSLTGTGLRRPRRSAGRRPAGTSGSARAGIRPRWGAGPRPWRSSRSNGRRACTSDTVTPRKTANWKVAIGKAGMPKTLDQDCVCDSPSYRIEPVAIAVRQIRGVLHRPPINPARAGRRRMEREAGSPSSTYGARRPRVVNQTEKVSPWARHASRPNTAMATRVSAV